MAPTLTEFANATIHVAPPISVGETPSGTRRIVPILGGSIAGGLAGTILLGGADYQFIRPDGTAELEARYAVRLTDGGIVYIVNTGIRSGPPQVLARLNAGETVAPNDIYFRTTPRFETAVPALAHLSRRLFLASGIRHPDRVDLAIFEVG